MRGLTRIAGGLVALMVASPVWASGGFSAMYVIGASLSDAGNVLAEVGFPAGPPVEPYFEGRFSDGPVYPDFLADILGLGLRASVDGGTNFANGGARTNYHRLEIDSTTTKPSPVYLLGPVGYSASPRMELGGIGYGFDTRCTGPFTTDPALVSSGLCIGYPADAFPWTIDGQVGAFHDLRVHAPPEPYADGLYIVFSGANDLSDLITATAIFCALPPTNPLRAYCPDESVQGDFISRIVHAIQGAIEEFVDAGARYIVVPYIPDLGLIPGLRFSPLSSSASDLTRATNTALGAMLAGLEAGWAGRYINLMPYDSFAFLNRVVSDPEDFGFTNATESCYLGFVNAPDYDSSGDLVVCPDPEDYVFFDKEHPTSALHGVLAQDMLAFMRVDMLDYLGNIVNGLTLKKSMSGALQRLLKGTRAILTDGFEGNDSVAVGQLQLFIEQIELFHGSIGDAPAEALTDGAEKLISLIGV